MGNGNTHVNFDLIVLNCASFFINANVSLLVEQFNSEMEIATAMANVKVT